MKRVRSLSRRQFLQTTGAGLASLALAGAPASRLLAQSDALQFYGWDFQPDTIRQHLDNFTAQSGTPVELHIIPNVGYSTVICSPGWSVS